MSQTPSQRVQRFARILAVTYLEAQREQMLDDIFGPRCDRCGVRVGIPCGCFVLRRIYLRVKHRFKMR